jgi:hypothetical protein
MIPSPRRTVLALTVAGLSAASLAASLGCGGAVNALKGRAEYDLRCPRDSLEARKVGDAWAVEGCGRSAMYVKAGVPPYTKWVRNSAVNSDEAAPVTTAKTSRPAASPVHDKPLYSARNLENHVVWNAQLKPQGADFTLAFVAIPQRDPDAATLQLQRQGAPHQLEACELKLVADGQLVALEEPAYSADARREQLSHALSLATLEVMTNAQVCSTRFELGTNDLALLSDFLVRVREELALSASSGGSAGPAATAP